MEANMCNHVVTSVAEGGSKCFPISKIRQRLGWSKEDQLVPMPVLPTYFYYNSKPSLNAAQNRLSIKVAFPYKVTMFHELVTLTMLGWINNRHRFYHPSFSRYHIPNYRQLASWEDMISSKMGCHMLKNYHLGKMKKKSTTKITKAATSVPSSPICFANSFIPNLIFCPGTQMLPTLVTLWPKTLLS